MGAKVINYMQFDIARLVLVLFFYLTGINALTEKYAYETRQFTVPLDHFNIVNNKTFSIRYLYNSSYVRHHEQHNKTPPPPIFFYTGNEGDINLFAQNAGFVWELAKNMSAYVVFAEHRYYGKSLPFGSATFNSSVDNLGYFTVEQTLEDYALLLSFLQAEHGRDDDLPVIVFGGSYGGMLSAWFRMKYPHLVLGALASSAPILQFHGYTPCEVFYDITTSIFKNVLNENCSANIKQSWSMLKSYGASEQGRKQLSDTLRLCQPLKTADDLKTLNAYLADIYTNLAMVNYPYETTFLAPLPPYPVRQFCYELREQQQPHNDSALLNALNRAISIYTNYTGHAKCVDYRGASSNADQAGWNIQSCIQMVMPICSDPKQSMFPAEQWNINDVSNDCYAKFHLRPHINDIALRYGGNKLQSASNIIFTNGLLDPWSGGGVLRDYGNNRITIIIIPEGAHHLDLRASNAADPPSVVDARNTIRQLIEYWINEYISITK